MAAEGPVPPQTPVDPPPPPSAGSRWLTWGIVIALVIVLVLAYLLVSAHG